MDQRPHANLRSLDERVQFMQNYLDSKPDDFDGIGLNVPIRPSPWAGNVVPTVDEALDFVGAVACRRALESGQPFLEHYLPAHNFRETERGTEYKRDPDFPILPPMWSRPDPDDDERFPDVSETPDDGLPDLRWVE